MRLTNAVAKFASASALIVALNHNSLLAGVTASEDDDDFSGFDDGHFEVLFCKIKGTVC